MSAAPTPNSRAIAGATPPAIRHDDMTPAAPHVRRVISPDDATIDAIVALEDASFTNPWPRDTLVWELRHSDVTRVYVLERDGAIAAFCGCWVVFDELHINTLAVAPEQRRQGLARVLLRAVIAEAMTSGVTKATLEVRASNAAALALYSGLGFAVAARREHYYIRPEEDALILWCQLGNG
jgi:ribosomal-protein-alanine N-acetyltransferase